ncbi:VOC family protein [Siphonobacter aquaeclarae]|uniref:Uncharacterized conserved protein PhnB, glyoxalase superfamily n=1 Tax=Siphonobacter aquaeclarae TaxID=563176 RepID=A0A1G9UFP9_9BACT|nr:VOC family protein [Siphonobacter aquaeclarae]SDM58738.1 Uncharacterized conserved protein PhnB, glyoxalase superfamily [Siphonobacter aquaeclarae]
MNIPNGHQAVMPYLILNGAPAFIAFTQEVFGATEQFRRQRDEHTIMHAEIRIGNSTIMFADATEQYPPVTAHLFVYVENADDVYERALNAGGSTVMELSNQDYGRTCGVADPFGNTWWITSVA